MSALDAIPGYTALRARLDATKAQALQYQAQGNAAVAAGNNQAAQQYYQQAAQATTEADQLFSQIGDLIQADINRDQASPTVTTGQSQSTPANNARDDGPTQAPTSGGVGAGTSSNSADSVRADNNPGASRSTTQQAINTAFASQPIIPQPNVLDQYASYTYGISWWLLSPAQFNGLSTAGPAPNTGNWSLLMQSGGAPIAGRNQAFPYDYYLDDLEIETVLAGKGTGMSTNGMSLKFKVVEPNGLTLIQNLFSAVSSVYGKLTATTNQATANAANAANANQSSGQTSNYMAAQFCLTIEFYGYDSQGNLINPARGQLSTSTTQAVIKKYYPFLIQNLTFRTVANQIEYYITGQPVAYDTATSQARGTIPFAFKLSGQTVGQLLQGSPAAATTAQATPGERQTKPAPAMVQSTPSPRPGASVNNTTVNAGVDANGNFTGETENPFAVGP
jgi:hypothetical protein